MTVPLGVSGVNTVSAVTAFPFSMKAFSGAFVHKRSHKEIFLAGDEVAVGYGVGQREHLGCTDFLLAVNRGGGLDFGDAVVDDRDTDGLSVLPNADGIDFLVGEIAVRRLQFLHKPVAVRDVLKSEYAVLAGFGGKESVLGSKLGFAAAEESELCTCNHCFGFTVDF